MNAPTHITVRVPMRIRRRPGRRTMVTPVVNGLPALSTKADPALVKALARGFRYQKLLDEGRYASISEMAEGERIERGYLGTLLRLTLLAPDVVEAVLSGRCPELTVARALGRFPVEWGAQQSVLSVSMSGLSGSLLCQQTAGFRTPCIRDHQDTTHPA